MIPISTELFRGIQASKWLSIYLFATPKEIKECFEIDPLKSVYLGCLGDLASLTPEKKDFFTHYESFIENPDRSSGKYLNISFYLKEETLLAFSPDQKRYLIKEKEPLIYVQPFYWHFSSEENRFREKVLSNDGVFWGLEIKFPQIYQCIGEGTLRKAWGETELAESFRKIQRWVRQESSPAIFSYQGHKITPGYRIGKSAKDYAVKHLLKEYPNLELL